MPDIKLDPAETRSYLRRQYSPSAVARLMDVHPSTVHRFIRREGIDTVLIDMANEYGTLQVLDTLLNEGCTQSDAARKLAVTPQYINQVMRTRNRKTTPDQQ